MIPLLVKKHTNVVWKAFQRRLDSSRTFVCRSIVKTQVWFWHSHNCMLTVIFIPYINIQPKTNINWWRGGRKTDLEPLFFFFLIFIIFLFNWQYDDINPPCCIAMQTVIVRNVDSSKVNRFKFNGLCYAWWTDAIRQTENDGVSRANSKVGFQGSNTNEGI